MSGESQTESDERLAQQSRGGSLVAFEELVVRYEGRIHRFALKFCRNEGAAQDITQDAFVRAYRAIGQFDCGRSFAAWLFAIARRKCLDHLRSLPPESDGTIPETADHNDPASLAASREEYADLWETAREKLPRAQFEAMWFRYGEEMSVAEVALVVRKTETHVKVLLFRAREALVTVLRNDADGQKNGAVAQTLKIPAAQATVPFRPALGSLKANL